MIFGIKNMRTGIKRILIRNFLPNCGFQTVGSIFERSNELASKKVKFKPTHSAFFNIFKYIKANK